MKQSDAYTSLISAQCRLKDENKAATWDCTDYRCIAVDSTHHLQFPVLHVNTIGIFQIVNCSKLLTDYKETILSNLKYAVLQTSRGNILPKLIPIANILNKYTLEIHKLSTTEFNELLDTICVDFNILQTEVNIQTTINLLDKI